MVHVRHTVIWLLVFFTIDKLNLFGLCMCHYSTYPMNYPKKLMHVIHCYKTARLRFFPRLLHWYDVPKIQWLWTRVHNVTQLNVMYTNLHHLSTDSYSIYFSFQSVIKVHPVISIQLGASEILNLANCRRRKIDSSEIQQHWTVGSTQ